MPIEKLKDIEIYYEITGEGENLLFIHGLGSSTRDWEKQVPVFSEKYQVIDNPQKFKGKSGKFWTFDALINGGNKGIFG